MTDSGITLEMEEISENDVLGAEAGGVKGKDQGKCILILSRGRRSMNRTMEHRSLNCVSSTYDRSGETMFTKDPGLLGNHDPCPPKCFKDLDYL